MLGSLASGPQPHPPCQLTCVADHWRPAASHGKVLTLAGCTGASCAHQRPAMSNVQQPCGVSPEDHLHARSMGNRSK
jgi:hypothetical protein